MKKISLGSFPLIDVIGKDRRIFESYLIKVISDLITANQLSNQIHADRVQYVTPLSIMKFIKEDQKELTSTQSLPGDNTQESDRDRKATTIKHAFKNTKALYQSIATDPFYRNNLFYPIYIEEQIKTNYGYNDYNYDFLVLANDLIRQQIVDEITFDDKATLVFLVLKCLLTPNLEVPQIGTSTNDGENFRKYFALFLETCKNENINPFDMFIKLVKAAGKQKRNNVPGALARISNRIMGNDSGTDIGKKYHSNSFVNLFNTQGEIKSAAFLTTVPLSTINEFLSDDNKGLDKDYNPILRQYSQAKTHEYGKILSVVDALAAFNKSNNIITDLNSNSIQTTLKAKDGNTLILNKDLIITEFETIYFRRFLEDIISIENMAINKVRSELLKVTKEDLTADNIITQESLTVDAAKTSDKLNKVQLDLEATIDKLKSFASSLGFDNFQEALQDPRIQNQEFLANKDSYIALSNSLAELTSQQTAQVQSIAVAPKAETIDKSNKSKLLSLQVNLEIFQAQLTALYSEIYQYIYSSKFDEDIITIKSKERINSDDLSSVLFTEGGSADLNSAKMTISEIANLFGDELDVNIKKEIMASFINPKSAKVDTKRIIKENLDNKILTNSIIKNIFIPIFTKYTNKAISDSNQLKDIRSENNPVLRKILGSRDLFKAYLLNSETLIAAYELLHYIDTLKYEEGIINHPVSKVSHPINKMDFMIKRLGLNDNPVFIFDKNNILLSMPGKLSLTGQNFISQVKIQEFVQFGQINWSRDLWNQNLMFGGIENTKNYKDLQKSVRNIEAEITSISKVIKDSQDKEVIKKQSALLAKRQQELANKQAKFEALKQQSQYGNNFTSNVQTNKRPEEPSNYQMQYRPGGRYNTGMDQNGYMPHERNIINQSRNGMDHLRQQNIYPNPRQQYPQEAPNLNPPGYGQQFRDNLNQRLAQNDYPDQNEPQNEFMNNPYIQQRTNQLNQFQN